MEYDPVKDKLQKILGRSVPARKLFFAAMDRLFLRSRYVRREILRLRRLGFAPLQIMDAGSGFGQYSFRLAKTFPRAQVLGLDLKPELVEAGNRFARQAGFGETQIRFEVGDLLNLQFASRFHLALSVDVLEHIAEDQKALTNIGRSLLPDGLFLLTTPYWAAGAAGQHAPAEVFIGEHVRPGYSREDLQEKLDRAEMELVQFTITYGTWGGIAWKLLQKAPMSWLSGRIWLLPLVALYFCLAYPLAWIFMQLDMRAQNQQGGGILAVARKR